MQPQPPIVIDENGSLEVYASASAACEDLEGIDVKNGEYEAFDSSGRRLEFSVHGEEIALAVALDSRADLDGLESRVRGFIGDARPGVLEIATQGDVALPDLLEALLRFQRGERPSRERRRWRHQSASFTGRSDGLA